MSNFAPGTTVRVPRFTTTLDALQEHANHVVLAYQTVLPDGVSVMPIARWEWPIPTELQSTVDEQALGIVALVEEYVGLGAGNFATGTTIRVTAITTTIDPSSGQVTALTPEYQLVLPDGTALPTQTWDVPLDPGAQAAVTAQAQAILNALVAALGPNVAQWSPPTLTPALIAASSSASQAAAVLTDQ